MRQSRGAKTKRALGNAAHFLIHLAAPNKDKKERSNLAGLKPSMHSEMLCISEFIWLRQIRK